MTVNERLFHLGLFEAFDAALASRDLAAVVAVLQMTNLTEKQAHETAASALASQSAMTPAQLHQWVSVYNWDNGLLQIWPIVENPLTEFATALLIYWRLDGPWLESTVNGVNTEAFRLQELVKSNLLSGFYAEGMSHFDPKGELSGVQLFKLRKAGFPEVLLGSSRLA